MKKKSLIRHLLPVPFVLLAFLYLAKWYRDAHFFDGYAPNLPLMERILEKGAFRGHVREKIAYQGIPGESVPALFHYPESGEAKLPCVVFLYGNDLGMAQVDELAEWYVEAGYAIFCQEQLGFGERKGAADNLGPIQSLTQPLSQAVIESRRTVDYLNSRKEIDTTNLTLFGVAMGAVVATNVLALERRYAQGILTWGGGDFNEFFAAQLADRESLGAITRFLFRHLSVGLLSPLEPLDCVHLISPRPLLLQNALHDESIPRACIERLHAKARLPKEIKWYDTGHSSGLKPEMIKQVIADQIAWLNTSSTPR